MLKILIIAALYIANSLTKLTLNNNFNANKNCFKSLLNTNLNNNDHKPIGIVNNIQETNCIDFYTFANTPIVIASGFRNYTTNSPKIRQIYVFLDDLESIGKVLSEMDFYYIFDVNGNYYFFVCVQLDDDKWIYEVSELIWRHSIMNFVLIYNTTAINVVGYNPFNKTILNFTNYLPHYADCTLFPNKLRNMYGYEIQVTLFDDWPKNVYENGKYIGLDSDVLNIVLEVYNATVKFYYFEKLLEAVQHLLDKGSDTIFVSVPALSNYNAFQYSKSSMMDDIIVMVPRTKESQNFSLFFHIFKTNTIWMIYVLVWFSLITVTCIINKLDKTHTESINKNIFELISIQFCISIPNFQVKCNPMKIVIIFLLFGGILYQSFLNATLLGILVNEKNGNDIKTLDELVQRKLPLHIDIMFKDSIMFFNSMITNIVNTTQKNVILSLQSFKNDGAYAMTESGIYTFANNFDNYLEMNRRLDDTYVKLEEHLIPTHKVYLLPHKSPYISIINNAITINEEYMLGNRRKLNNGNHHKKRRHMRKHMDVLCMHHMLPAFYTLMSGLSFAMAIFFAEVLYKLREKLKN